MSSADNTFDAGAWVPERRGEVYCSPACGMGCLYKDYTKACSRAQALAMRLGPGWRPNVWENFGWHFSAVKANAAVHAQVVGGVIEAYTCYFNFDRAQFIQRHPTAVGALNACIDDVRRQIDALQRQLAVVVM